MSQEYLDFSDLSIARNIRWQAVDRCRICVEDYGWFSVLLCKAHFAFRSERARQGNDHVRRENVDVISRAAQVTMLSAIRQMGRNCELHKWIRIPWRSYRRVIPRRRQDSNRDSELVIRFDERSSNGFHDTAPAPGEQVYTELAEKPTEGHR